MASKQSSVLTTHIGEELEKVSILPVVEKKTNNVFLVELTAAVEGGRSAHQRVRPQLRFLL